MCKYQVVPVKENYYKSWDAIVEKSKQGTAFARTDYLLASLVNFKLWFVFCGPHEIKGGLLIIESSCGRHIELDDMVVYGGLIFVDDPSQKRSSAHAQRFEITSYLVDEMTKKYERIELSLSPCCDDLRP